MQTSIDKFGRVIIPKNIRDHLGLHPGVILEIEEINNEILLKVLDEKPALKRKDGILVFTGKLVGNIDNVIHKHREERLKDLGDTES